MDNCIALYFRSRSANAFSRRTLLFLSVSPVGEEKMLPVSLCLRVGKFKENFGKEKLIYCLKTTILFKKFLCRSVSSISATWLHSVRQLF